VNFIGNLECVISEKEVQMALKQNYSTLSDYGVNGKSGEYEITTSSTYTDFEDAPMLV
jgi:hypothetical protein